MRRLPLILVIALLLITTATAVFAEGAQETDAAQQEIELRLGWWGGQARHDIYYELIEAYEEERPNVTLNAEPASWGDYWNRLTTQAAGGNAPDILHMHLTRLHEFASRGVLLDLDPYVEEGILDLSNWTPAIVESGKYNGSIYTVSIGNSITATFVNESGFQDIGVELPDIRTSWTWDEFIEILRQARDAIGDEDRWVLLDQSAGDTPFAFFLRQRGRPGIFNEDGQLGFTRDDLTEWWEMWAMFREERIIPPAEVIAEHDGVDHADRLLTKRGVLVNFTPGNQIPRFERHTDDTIRMRRYPTYPQAEGEGEFVEGAYISAAANSEYPEEAVRFIDWFMNTEEAISIFQSEHGAFGNPEMNEFIMPQLEPSYAHVIEFTQFASGFASPRVQYPQGSSEVLDDFFANASQAIAFGDMPIDEAVDRFFADASSVLE